MSKSKPQMKSSSLSGKSEAGYDERQIEEASERKRVPFSTILDAGLYEKLKTMAFYNEGSIADLVNEAIRRALREKETERGAPYRPPAPLQIDEEQS